jgi:hypothetical protein
MVVAVAQGLCKMPGLNVHLAFEVRDCPSDPHEAMDGAGGQL